MTKVKVCPEADPVMHFSVSTRPVRRLGCQHNQPPVDFVVVRLVRAANRPNAREFGEYRLHLLRMKAKRLSRILGDKMVGLSVGSGRPHPTTTAMLSRDKIEGQAGTHINNHISFSNKVTLQEV